MEKTKLFRLLLVFFVFISSAAFSNEIQIVNQKINIASGVGSSAAVYFSIRNLSDKPDTLLKVQSLAAKKVMLHETLVSSEGVASMRHLMAGLGIQGGEKITLKSGGVHIMMMGLIKPFADGDLIKIKLFFENAGEVIVNLVVGNGD